MEKEVNKLRPKRNVPEPVKSHMPQFLCSDSFNPARDVRGSVEHLLREQNSSPNQLLEAFLANDFIHTYWVDYMQIADDYKDLCSIIDSLNHIGTIEGVDPDRKRANLEKMKNNAESVLSRIS